MQMRLVKTSDALRRIELVELESTLERVFKDCLDKDRSLTEDDKSFIRDVKNEILERLRRFEAVADVVGRSRSLKEKLSSIDKKDVYFGPDLASRFGYIPSDSLIGEPVIISPDVRKVTKLAAPMFVRVEVGGKELFRLASWKYECFVGSDGEPIRDRETVLLGYEFVGDVLYRRATEAEPDWLMEQAESVVDPAGLEFIQIVPSSEHL